MYSLNNKQQQFKKVSPSIYDFVFENHLDWPVNSCQWGPIQTQSEDVVRQKVFFVSKTDGLYNEKENTWQKQPSTLIIANLDIPKKNKIFNQCLRDVFLQEKLKKHINLNVKQIIIHPGDANVMKKCPLNQKMIATKNDSNQIYIWDLDKHKGSPNLRDGCSADQPDITLVGHDSKVPSFALDWSKTSYRIGSGGKDLTILIWDLDDYQGKMQSGYMYSSKRELNSIGNNENIKASYTHKLQGHTDCIEDLSFSPTDKDVLVSVSDDKTLLGWDLRINTKQHFQIDNLHNDDINCVDWCEQNNNYIATGSSDGTACLVDMRMRKSVLKIQLDKDDKGQPNSIMSLNFSPFSDKYLAIGADNIYFYDIKNYIENDQSLNLPQNNKIRPIFTHFGCKGVANDFDWNPELEWTILNTSQENPDEQHSQGGGQLQTFRPLDLAYLSKEEAVQKLKNTFQQYENQ